MTGPLIQYSIISELANFGTFKVYVTQVINSYPFISGNKVLTFFDPLMFFKNFWKWKDSMIHLSGSPHWMRSEFWCVICFHPRAVIARVFILEKIIISFRPSQHGIMDKKFDRSCKTPCLPNGGNFKIEEKQIFSLSSGRRIRVSTNPQVICPRSGVLLTAAHSWFF